MQTKQTGGSSLRAVAIARASATKDPHVLRWFRHKLVQLFPPLGTGGSESATAIRHDALAIELARTADDFEAALRLLHDCFADAGIADRHTSGIRVCRHDLMNPACTAVAKHDGTIVGALSLILDSEQALPIDQPFGDELKRYRQPGRRLAELTGLAVRPDAREGGLILKLLRPLFAVAKANGVTDFVAAVPQNRIGSYREIFLCEKIGEPKPYPVKRRDHLVAVRLDLHRLQERYQHAYRVAPADVNIARALFGGADSSAAATITPLFKDRFIIERLAPYLTGPAAAINAPAAEIPAE